MALLDRILGRRQDELATTGQYVPAESTGTALRRTGTEMLDKAGQFYKQNPRKVQMVGLLAAAALLTRLGSGRR